MALNFNNKKRSLLFLVTGTTLFLTFTGARVQNQSVLAQTAKKYPLPLNDPAAILAPNLVNIPPIIPPAQNRTLNVPSSQPSNNVEIGYDVRTRSTKVGARIQILPQNQSSTNFSPAYRGGDTNVNLEPRVSGSISPNTVQPHTVIGSDDRVLITNTTAYPWRTITKLFMTFPSGKKFVCSGTLIAAKYVLTAGHCIHNSSEGGWANKVEVVPGLSGTYKPYGSAFAAYMRSYTAWTSSQNPNYDFALITLNKNIGNTTGWLGYAYYPSINGITANLAGYPGDRNSGLGLYYHYGPVMSSTSQRLFYSIDTAGGQSGSGVYRRINSDRYVFAVHTNGSGGTLYNSGARIDSQKFNDIKRWIASGT
ncbi:trypsin-like serine protease [Gloeocapsa sp. BRSZ]